MADRFRDGPLVASRPFFLDVINQLGREGGGRSRVTRKASLPRLGRVGVRKEKHVSGGAVWGVEAADGGGGREANSSRSQFGPQLRVTVDVQPITTTVPRPPSPPPLPPLATTEIIPLESSGPRKITGSPFIYLSSFIQKGYRMAALQLSTCTVLFNP